MLPNGTWEARDSGRQIDGMDEGYHWWELVCWAYGGFGVHALFYQESYAKDAAASLNRDSQQRKDE